MRKTVGILVVMFAGLLGVLPGRPALAMTAGPRVTSSATIVQTALAFLGEPYIKQGATPTKGFNDLGFVRYVYGRNGIQLHISVVQRPRVYSHLLSEGTRVAMSDLQLGDIVFFRDTLFKGLSHVGIYVGDGSFVHAEWFSRGVTVSAFQNDPEDGSYWATKFVTGVRLTVGQ